MAKALGCVVVVVALCALVLLLGLPLSEEAMAAGY